MSTITKLFSNGLLQSSVQFDEITYTTVKVNPAGIYASNFDEVSNPGVAERRLSNGTYQVSGFFDEVSIAPQLGVNTNGLQLYLDAGNGTSYPGTGDNWYDLSGIGNNFVFNDGATFTGAGNQSYFTFGNVATATGGSILSATAYTKIVIFQVSGAYGNIISANGDSNHAFWGAFTDVLQSGHNGNWGTVQASVTTPLNQWVFGAVTFNNITGWRLYLNQNTPTTSSSTDTFTPDTSDVEIGGFQGNSNNMNGELAVAMIYNRVLTDDEINQTYAYFQPRFSLS